MSHIARFALDERGTTLVEYSLLYQPTYELTQLIIHG